MFDAKELFKERLSTHFKRLNRYLRYIFNGHFMIALLFIIITIAIYYQQWLENLSDSFPTLIVCAVILGIVVTYNPLQLLLKAPDKVFLIAKETSLYTYFRCSLLYNYVVQLYIIFIAYVALLPLYMHTKEHVTKGHLIALLLILLIVKAWNMILQFFMIQLHSERFRFVEASGRLLVTVLFLYSWLSGKYVVISVLILFGYLLNSYRIARKRDGLAWDLLIANDEARLGSFYRFVQMFADVPHVKRKMKKRKWLTSLVHTFMEHEHAQSYRYLYLFTFFRSVDYFPLFIRLTVIGILLILFVPLVVLKIGFALLFLYMTLFQLVSLYYHHDTVQWLRLYPLQDGVREQTFTRFLLGLGLVQTFIFSITFIFLFQFLAALITLVLGNTFIHLFTSLYVRKKITK